MPSPRALALTSHHFNPPNLTPSQHCARRLLRAFSTHSCAILLGTESKRRMHFFSTSTSVSPPRTAPFLTRSSGRGATARVGRGRGVRRMRQPHALRIRRKRLLVVRRCGWSHHSCGLCLLLNWAVPTRESRRSLLQTSPRSGRARVPREANTRFGRFTVAVRCFAETPAPVHTLTTHS